MIAPGASLQLYLEDTYLDYPIASLGGQIKRLAALRLLCTTRAHPPQVAPCYQGEVTQPLLVPAEAPEALPLVAARHIVTAHYGVALQEEDLHSYILPVHLRAIRDKAMDQDSFARPMMPAPPADPASLAQEQALIQAIRQQAPQVDLARVQRAIDLARQYHAGTFRKSGEPFYHHPMAVARLLLAWTQDEEALIAALLHDTVEDTSLSLAKIALLFSPRVARLVEGVTKLDASERRMALSGAENLQKLENLTQLVGKLGFLVKIADRIHNLQTIEGHSRYEKQRRIAEETQSFFIPLAYQLGWQEAARQLEQLVAQILSRQQ